MYIKLYRRAAVSFSVSEVVQRFDHNKVKQKKICMCFCIELFLVYK